MGIDVQMIRRIKQSQLAKIRQSILDEQNGLCPICKNEIEEGCACLDHEHKKRIRGSGQLRAVLCRNCNTFLGKIENNSRRCNITLGQLPVILRRISKYLLKEHKPILHPSEKEKPPKLQKVSYNELKKKYSGRAKFPEYPKTGRITIRLKNLFEEYLIKPKFYKK